MSDFLTRLAARTIAQPTLRPRTRSRFEPVSEVAPAEDSWSDGLQPAEERRVETRVDEPASRRVVEPEPAPAALEDSKTRRLVDSPVHTRETVRLEKHPVLQTRVERATEHVTETRDRILRERETIHHHQDPQLLERERTIIKHRVDEQPPRILTRTERIERESVQREPARNAEPAMRNDALPDIHISIGRVEVRAGAQTAPQRRTPQRTGMTIDDYVARRKAKERR